MTFLYFLILGTVFVFITISLALLFKRYRDNKTRLENINKDSSHQLKAVLEEELNKKKEQELQRIALGDFSIVPEIIDRLFKSSRMSALIQSYQFSFQGQSSITLTAQFADLETVIQEEKEIVLKSGETYRQKKHFLAMKKEYSEKFFFSAVRIIEEVFQAIPVFQQIYLNEYLSGESEPFCALSVKVSRDDYNKLKTETTDSEKILESLNARYNFDAKNFYFREIEPVSASSKIESFGLKQEPLKKKNSDFSNYNEKKREEKKENFPQENFSEEKRVEPVEKSPEKEEFSKNIVRFLNKSQLVVTKEKSLGLNEKMFVALRPSLIDDRYVIFVSEETKIIKEAELNDFFELMNEEEIDKGIFISCGSFSLEAVSFAAAKNILLFDQDKLLKSV